ncbi:MAG: SUF system NifU family Fe-S cluster assembly protein [Xanthomonadales bacterium]|nr:SUF system NifU family Fe-S cluster assembly protein [Xanthomonadales bacterium]
MSISDLYRSAVLDHNREPCNFKELEGATHEARGLNALCGDDLRVFLRIDARSERILEAAFIGTAGAITMASASMMTEAVRDRTITEALALKEALGCLLRAPEVTPELAEGLGELSALEGVRRYPSRIRAALLAWETLAAALEGEPIATTEGRDSTHG